MKQTAAVQQNFTLTKCFPNIMSKTKNIVLILKVILLLKMCNDQHQNVWYKIFSPVSINLLVEL